VGGGIGLSGLVSSYIGYRVLKKNRLGSDKNLQKFIIYTH